MKKLVFIFIITVAFSCKDEVKKNDATNKDSLNKTTKIPAAINALIEQSKKDTGNIDLQLNIVKILDSVGLYKDALQHLDKVIATDSLFQDYWFIRGKLCNKLKDTAAAIKAFNYAAKIYPKPETLLELADLFALTKNPNTLIICDVIMKNNPGGDYNDKAVFFKAVYYSKINDKQKALSLFDKCISYNYHFAEAYLEKGFIYFDEKKYNEALKIFEQLTNVNPANADGYYWQAKCKEAMNNKEEAIALYKKSLQLDESIAEAREAITKLTVKN